MNSTDIEKLGFQEAAAVYVRDGVADALFNDYGKTVAPGVYCWLQQSAQGEEEIVYVGMFGKALPKRFREHRQGFQGGSASGTKKGKFLYESLDAGNIVKIYARPSASIEIEYTNVLGEEVLRSVGTQAMDELEMIEYVLENQGRPVLNGTKGG